MADIENIVSAWTGIPVESMGQDEKDRLVKLSSVLKEHVIGQDEAVETLASALMRARCGLNDPNRPVASLLFVGPTGAYTPSTGVQAEIRGGQVCCAPCLHMACSAHALNDNLPFS